MRRPSPKFVQECLELLGLEEANPVFTPGHKGLDESSSDVPLDQAEVALYRTVVGKLLYVSEEFPEYMFAVKECSRELREPTSGSFRRLKHLVRFLKGRAGVCTCFRPVESSTIDVYVDSKWGNCKVTRKSSDCVLLMVHGCLLYASCKTHSFIAQSSGEAEMAAIHRGGLMGILRKN